MRAEHVELAARFCVVPPREDGSNSERCVELIPPTLHTHIQQKCPPAGSRRSVTSGVVIHDATDQGVSAPYPPP
ncbi:hypothetical protein ON010_g3906 [Phytophthora cinnamomi]|nr:hypothetical protein ON010_g3906 [Phytophthora cinnamomi]